MCRYACNKCLLCLTKKSTKKDSLKNTRDEISTTTASSPVMQMILSHWVSLYCIAPRIRTLNSLCNCAKLDLDFISLPAYFALVNQSVDCEARSLLCAVNYTSVSLSVSRLISIIGIKCILLKRSTEYDFQNNPSVVI